MIISKKIYYTYLFAIALLQSQAYGQERLWVNYYENYFYDSNSVTCKKNICNVGLMLLPRPNTEKLSDRPDVYIKSTIYALQINCRDKLVTNSIFVIHNFTDGSSKEEQDGRVWIPIKPESRDDILSNVVCSRLAE